jgi:hypothetical protein
VATSGQGVRVDRYSPVPLAPIAYDGKLLPLISAMTNRDLAMFRSESRLGANQLDSRLFDGLNPPVSKVALLYEIQAS